MLETIIFDTNIVNQSMSIFVQGLIEIPYILVQTLIYGLITYSMIQFEWTAGENNYFTEKKSLQATWHAFVSFNYLKVLMKFNIWQAFVE